MAATPNKRLTDDVHSPYRLIPLLGNLDAPLLAIEGAIAMAAPGKLHKLKSILVASKRKLQEAIVKTALQRDAARGMTTDTARALFLYTADSFVFGDLNSALREGVPANWLGLIRLLSKAAAALPKAPGTRVVYRGVRLNLVEDYPDEYAKGKYVVWSAFTSTTFDLEVLNHKNFLGTEGGRTLFQITTRGGVDISEYSAIRLEREVRFFFSFSFRRSKSCTRSTAQNEYSSIHCA